MKLARLALNLTSLLALSLVPLSAASSQDELECLPDAGPGVDQRIDSAALGRAKRLRFFNG